MIVSGCIALPHCRLFARLPIAVEIRFSFCIRAGQVNNSHFMAISEAACDTGDPCCKSAVDGKIAEFIFGICVICVGRSFQMFAGGESLLPEIVIYCCYMLLRCTWRYMVLLRHVAEGTG